ncbi:mCG4193, isoform CRA_a [Mus musculus]|nr:mCG4193, isoform CRA_a [Mus musculus]
MELLTGTDLWPVAIFTVIFILLVDLLHRRQRWTSRYPPGPVPWPVLGNLLQVDLDNMPYSFYKVVKMFPIVLRIPGLADKIFPGQKTFLTMVDKLVTEHKRTWDPDQPPRDLTDAFMAEMETAKGNPESSFNEANLRLVVLDLFGGGIVTTSATLTWALLLMILHPDVQRETDGAGKKGGVGYRHSS